MSTNLDGIKDMTLELKTGGRVGITFQFESPDHARRAYEYLSDESRRRGEVMIKLTCGEQIVEN